MPHEGTCRISVNSTPLTVRSTRAAERPASSNDTKVLTSLHEGPNVAMTADTSSSQLLDSRFKATTSCRKPSAQWKRCLGALMHNSSFRTFRPSHIMRIVVRLQNESRVNMLKKMRLCLPHPSQLCTGVPSCRRPLDNISLCVYL